ncbi:MAG: thioredoxin family protein [Acidobacteria bacterium]|nr:thioredoxin family protein [Acidobacteriota bacterium]MBK8148396.1 thioredoxin family protein [Acidobacteriota bacterium]MBK8813321.1 thioredoxin family protein [Acidobacteriota bacterium]
MKRAGFFLIALFAISAIFATAPNVGFAGGLEIGATVESFTLPDLDGANKSLNDLKGANGTVVVWLSAQCPVVKGYNERINQIAEEFKAKGINFVGINSNATESLDWVKSNAAEVGYKFPVLIDKGNALADKFGATVTPEIFYFDAKNVLLYHGAIDDDRSGKNVQSDFLRDASVSALGGKAIARSSTKAFGCTIKRTESK